MQFDQACFTCSAFVYGQFIFTTWALSPFFYGCRKIRMRMPEQLAKLIEPAVTGLGYELVDLEFESQGRILRLYIDHADGITIDDCSKVSYQVSGILEVEDPISGQYQLEVSSPGMDRPLVKPEHFQRFTGQMARIQILRPIGNQKRFKGRITAASDESVTLETETGSVELTYGAIEKARLVPEF
ncbi:MAG: ribosome maturation factor RimP [Pseudomonadota bacterium]|jgi:ribosome maturation factor RimP